MAHAQLFKVQGNECPAGGLQTGAGLKDSDEPNPFCYLRILSKKLGNPVPNDRSQLNKPALENISGLHSEVMESDWSSRNGCWNRSITPPGILPNRHKTHRLNHPCCIFKNIFMETLKIQSVTGLSWAPCIASAAGPRNEDYQGCLHHMFDFFGWGFIKSKKVWQQHPQLRSEGAWDT